MGLTEGHWFEDEEELTERQLEKWVADNKAAYGKGLRDGKPKWISVNDRLPNDIIVCLMILSFAALPIIRILFDMRFLMAFMNI